MSLNGRLQQTVAAKLALNWSPEQIAGWLKRAPSGIEARSVSHNTIYRSLSVQARDVLKRELVRHLRTRRPLRRSRHASAKADQRGRIPDAVSIQERPASAEDRGSKNSYVVTLVERHSRYLILAKVSSRHTQTVIAALIQQARRLPDELAKSLTWAASKRAKNPSRPAARRIGPH